MLVHESDMDPISSAWCEEPDASKDAIGSAATGIFIGTTTVIWLVAIGEGVSYKAQQQIMELGATNIIIRSVEPQSAENQNERVKSYGLTRADYKRILSNVPAITQAVPIREVSRNFLVAGRTAKVNLVGSSIGYKGLNRLEIARTMDLRPGWPGQRDRFG